MPKIKYTEEQKQEIIKYKKDHTWADVKEKFGVRYVTVRCWYDLEFKKKQQAHLLKDKRKNIDKRKEYRKDYNDIQKAAQPPIDRTPKWVKPLTTSVIHKNILSYAYSKEECIKELKKIQDKPASLNPVTNLNKIVLTYQPHFYETENKLWFDNDDDLRSRLVKNRQKHIGKVCDEFTLTDKEMLRSFKISGKHIGFSHFNPTWIKYFIEKYNVKSIYDPCGGWGHRLLGAQDIKYIYNDLDIRTYNGCVNIVNDFNLTNKTLYNKDSSKFTPSEDYDAVFTCPPYNNVEVYQDKTFKSQDDYLNWWSNTIKCSVKDGVKYFAYVINHTFLNETKEVCIKNGLTLIEESNINLKFNHFQKKTTSIKSESMCVFSTNSINI